VADAINILEQGAQGLDDAVSMLDMIHDVLGSLGNEGPPMRDDTSFEFPLEAAIHMLPRRYVKEFDASIIKGETILIKCDDLFEQLKTGKIAVPISALAFYIPVDLVYSATFQDETVMRLPIQLVVHSVGIEELAKRIPNTLRTYDIVGFEDPFPENMSSRSAAAASDAPAVLLEDDDDEPADELLGEAQPLRMADPTVLAKPELEPPPTQMPNQEQVLDIDELLEEAQPTPAAEKQQSDTTFDYPAKDAVQRLTSGATGLLEDMDPGMTVPIDLPDIFEQLKHGTVSIPTRDLAKQLPSAIRPNERVLHGGTTTNLALDTVVAALGIEALASRISAPLRDFDIERMVDPFPKSAARPPPLVKDRRSSRSRVAGAQQVDARRVAGDHFADGDTSTSHHAATAPAEQGYRELPGNININTATAEELTLLEGIDRSVAKKIVKHRNKNGPFTTIFDLLTVGSLEAPALQQMSGMRVGAGVFNRRQRLASLLRIPAGQVTDLPQVAEAVIRKPDFSGCVISDANGLVLAQAGMDESADRIAAIVPRLLRRVQDDMSLIGAGTPRTASITTSEMCFTVASHRSIAVSTIHRHGQINETDLAFVRKLVLELAWLISLRAYAGPAA